MTLSAAVLYLRAAAFLLDLRKDVILLGVFGYGKLPTSRWYASMMESQTVCTDIGNAFLDNLDGIGRVKIIRRVFGGPCILFDAMIE